MYKIYYSKNEFAVLNDHPSHNQLINIPYWSHPLSTLTDQVQLEMDPIRSFKSNFIPLSKTFKVDI